jgi:hypothetical protein
MQDGTCPKLGDAVERLTPAADRANLCRQAVARGVGWLGLRLVTKRRAKPAAAEAWWPRWVQHHGSPRPSPSAVRGSPAILQLPLSKCPHRTKQSVTAPRLPLAGAFYGSSS